MTNEINNQIKQLIDNNDIVLFMKGSNDFPQCGFSATVTHILNTIGANYLDVDVLQDMNIRQGIKEFSDWPTIPQLYVKGEFVGGCDIIRDMHEEGELAELLKKHQLI